MKKMLVVLAIVGVALLSSFACAGVRCAVMQHSSHGQELRPVTAHAAEYTRAEDLSGEVYTKGKGSPVLLLHELPGFTPEFVKFADRVARSHTVYAPVMFGGFGRKVTFWEQLEVMLGSDFNTASRKESRIVGPLAELAKQIQAKHPGQKLGIVGMCLTGGLPVAIAAREGVKASALVLSQPSIPFPLWSGAEQSFGVDPGAPAKVAHLPIMLLRMEHDCLSTEKRAAAIMEALQGKPILRRVKTDSKKAHAVLTIESQNPHHANPDAEAAVNEVVAFLDKHVR